jgi:hypothetical protein
MQQSIRALLILTIVYVARAFWHSGPAAWRDSAGGAEERKAGQPERIDGPRRAHRPLRLLPIVSTWALMKELHQKKALKVMQCGKC